MIRIDARGPVEPGLTSITDVLHAGGVVCFPTDTTYGLGADPANPAAIGKLFNLKGRAPDKPVLLLVDSIEMASTLGVLSGDSARIASRLWPAPLTLVVPARPVLSTRITAGTGTVGLRWPDAVLPQRLLGAFGRPLTATSANRSGARVASTVDRARRQLGAGLDAAIDIGRLPPAAPSTILDLTSEPPRILRRGPVGFDALAEALNGNILEQPA
jgi:L-threonylcarbamoyladenylate synthase